jgi:hypothetical protein
MPHENGKMGHYWRKVIARSFTEAISHNEYFKKPHAPRKWQNGALLRQVIARFFTEAISHNEYFQKSPCPTKMAKWGITRAGHCEVLHRSNLT